MLAVDAIETSYGVSQVLFGVSLEVGSGHVVTLLGRNGMGKTTTIRSIMGIAPPKGGTIRFDGRPIHGLPPYRVAQAGLGLVPEGRQVFPNLTVRENLVATAANRGGSAAPWRVDAVFELFPQLAVRARSLGGALSGGEQQMLAIGRALMTNPRLLILDEVKAEVVGGVTGGVNGDQGGAVALDLLAVTQIMDRLRQRGVANDHLRDVKPSKARPELGDTSEVIGVAMREDDP